MYLSISVFDIAFVVIVIVLACPSHGLKRTLPCSEFSCPLTGALADRFLLDGIAPRLTISWSQRYRPALQIEPERLFLCEGALTGRCAVQSVRLAILIAEKRGSSAFWSGHDNCLIDIGFELPEVLAEHARQFCRLSVVSFRV